MAGMPHDINGSPSYEHMMGSVHKAHEGSQSSAPTKDPGGTTEMKVKGSKGKKLPEKAKGGMSYSDE
jgi:hypothetical protein